MSTTSSSTNYEVIVIGAGISGLRAASELKNVFGLTKIKVLEARTKIGGRVQQDNTFLPGRQLEVGAEFIHGDINHIVELCEEHGWARRHIFTWSHGDGGPAEGPAPDGGIGYYWIGKEGKLLRYDDEDPDMKRCNEALWNLQYVDKDAAEADTRTLKQYLQDEGVPERMLGLACAGYGNTAGGTSDTVPASRAMRFERAWHGDGSELDPDFRMEPSFGVLISTLAKDLDIEINSPVKSVTVDTTLLDQQTQNMLKQQSIINTNEDPVATTKLSAPEVTGIPPCTVTTVDGRVYHSYRVLVSVPLPVLKDGDITFNPPLSPEKVAAAQSMSFANGVKIIMKFNRRAWPKNCHGVVCADSLIPEMWMNSNKGVGGLIEGQNCRYAASIDDEASNPATTGVICASCLANNNTNTNTGYASDTASLPDTSCPKCGGPSIAATSASSVTTTTSTSAPVPSIEDDDEPGTLYTVTGFIMGVRADNLLRENSHEVIIARMLSQIDTMFGKDATGAYIDGFVHSWAEEPYIRGAYSTPTFRELPDASRRLAEPHLNTVFFAGEATAGAIDGKQRDHPNHRAHYASPIVLHGAMNTGSSAACDIARSFGLPITCTDEGHAHFMPTYRHEGTQPSPTHADSLVQGDIKKSIKNLNTNYSSNAPRPSTPCSAIRRGAAAVTPRNPISADPVPVSQIVSP